MLSLSVQPYSTYGEDVFSQDTRGWPFCFNPVVYIAVLTLAVGIGATLLWKCQHLLSHKMVRWRSLLFGSEKALCGIATTAIGAYWSVMMKKGDIGFTPFHRDVTPEIFYQVSQCFRENRVLYTAVTWNCAMHVCRRKAGAALLTISGDRNTLKPDGLVEQEKQVFTLLCGVMERSFRRKVFQEITVCDNTIAELTGRIKSPVSPIHQEEVYGEVLWRLGKLLDHYSSSNDTEEQSIIALVDQREKKRLERFKEGLATLALPRGLTGEALQVACCQVEERFQKEVRKILTDPLSQHLVFYCNEETKKSFVVRSIVNLLHAMRERVIFCATIAEEHALAGSQDDEELPQGTVQQERSPMECASRLYVSFFCSRVAVNTAYDLWATWKNLPDQGIVLWKKELERFVKDIDHELVFPPYEHEGVLPSFNRAFFYSIYEEYAWNILQTFSELKNAFSQDQHRLEEFKKIIGACLQQLEGVKKNIREHTSPCESFVSQLSYGCYPRDRRPVSSGFYYDLIGYASREGRLDRCKEPLDQCFQECALQKGNETEI